MFNFTPRVVIVQRGFRGNWESDIYGSGFLWINNQVFQQSSFSCDTSYSTQAELNFNLSGIEHKFAKFFNPANTKRDKEFYEIVQDTKDLYNIYSEDFDKAAVKLANVLHMVYGLSEYVLQSDDKTKQVFINIIDNAIKYSGCETLNISTKRSPNKMEVIINEKHI